MGGRLCIKCVMRRVGSAERKRPCVTGWLRFKNFKGRPVIFLLDTGAELNILSATDARLIGIDLASYPQPNPPIEIRGVGGDVPNEAVGILKDCTVEFASSHGPWQAIVGDMLVIKDEKYASKYHSILGCDFLKNTGLTLKINFIKDMVELYQP